MHGGSYLSDRGSSRRRPEAGGATNSASGPLSPRSLFSLCGSAKGALC